MEKIKIYHAPRYYVIEGPPPKGDKAIVLADDAYNAIDARDKQIAKLRGALEGTLDRIRLFRCWFEDEYMEHVEVDDPLLNEVARLGLTGLAESLLDEA
jgi:hypothetical protein